MCPPQAHCHRPKVEGAVSFCRQAVRLEQDIAAIETGMEMLSGLVGGLADRAPTD